MPIATKRTDLNGQAVCPTARPAASATAALPDDQQSRAVREVQEADCCIVGGGPAGVVLALLLVRQGLNVVLLERHADFERDFRGDTIHPSTLELMEQLGLIDRLLALPHARSQGITIHGPGGPVMSSGPTALKTKYQFTAVMPQARFLDFIAAEARRYPSFRLVMGARVEELAEEDGAVRGVRYRGHDGWYEVRAPLTVGADGRFSKIRQLAGVAMVGSAQSLDVLSFRLPRRPDDTQQGAAIYVGVGRFLVVAGRPQDWQIGYLFPKGGYQQLRAAGIETLRRSTGEVVPWLADRTAHLQDWTQASVLSIESGRVRRWYRPGLLLIGDAAHVMSPVGGVGINCAVQDAVVTSNLIGPRLKRGALRTLDLAAVQRRREWPTRIIQALQGNQQRQLLAAAAKPRTLPLSMRLLARVGLLRNLRTRFFLFGGFWPERVRA